MSNTRAVEAEVVPPGVTVPETVRRYFDYVNNERFDRMGELWHADGEFVAVGARPRRGREDVTAYYPTALAPLPEHHDEPTRYIIAGDTVVVEIHFVGRAADDTEVEFDAIDVFDLDDGRIRRVTSWYDTARVRSLIDPHPRPREDEPDE